MVDFGTAIQMLYGNFTNFEGRSRRSEYWWVQLYLLMAYVLIGVIYVVTGGGFGDVSGSGGTIGVILFVIFALGHVLPLIALSVRRFHDLGQTGWLVLLFMVVGAIPVVGLLSSIGQLICFCQRGTQGPNQYGAGPLGGYADDLF